MEFALEFIGLLSALSGAGLGVLAARVHVRNNLDEFMDDIKRQSRLASWAATVTAVSATVQAIKWLAYE